MFQMMSDGLCMYKLAKCLSALKKKKNQNFSEHKYVVGSQFTTPM